MQPSGHSRKSTHRRMICMMRTKTHYKLDSKTRYRGLDVDGRLMHRRAKRLNSPLNWYTMSVCSIKSTHRQPRQVGMELSIYRLYIRFIRIYEVRGLRVSGFLVPDPTHTRRSNLVPDSDVNETLNTKTETRPRRSKTRIETVSIPKYSRPS
jgi:hypothetical protein